MKFKFYMICCLAVSLAACQKQLLTATEQNPQLGLKNLKANLKESDGFFNGHPPDTSYHMQFTDRFYSNNIDANGEGWWKSRTGAFPNNGLTTYCRAENDSVSLVNNKLNITFHQEADKYYGGGIISTKTFGYGYYEARIKLYTGSYGLHQSFWSFADAIEIDGSETDSKINDTHLSTYHPNRWTRVPAHVSYHPTATEKQHFVTVPYTSIHSPGQGLNNKWTDTSGTYVTIGYEWLPDKVNYYVNDTLRNSYGLVDNFGNSVNAFQPANVYLTALPLKVSPQVDMVKPQSYAAMQVDYFAFYEKRLPGINLLGNAAFNYTDSSASHALGTFFGWNTNPFKVNGIITYGNTDSDVYNSNVIKESNNYYLQQKNTGQAYKAETFQTLYYVLPGTYTFSSDIRCSGAGSKFIVLDKDKTTILYSRTIMGPHSDWIHISDNIPVTNNEVTILIYSDAAQGAWLQVDNVNFSLNH